jgi:hypothetical protein
MLALSDNDVWAVGYANPGGLGLILHWDGASWQSWTSPTGTAHLTLWSLSASSPTDVWAVGNAENGPAILHFDGSTWSVIPSASPAHDKGLEAVSSLTRSDAWAVGASTIASSNGGSVTQALIEHWNGTTWEVSPMSATLGTLMGVSAVAPDDAWAVGQGLTSTGGGGYISAPLIMHWNGISWDQVANPDPEATLRNVSASSSTDVWIVGDTAFLHWNGVRWTVLPIPVPETFPGVLALSATDAWAVGSSSGKALVDHWNGSTWTVTSSNSEGATDLNAVAAAANGVHIWVGGFDTPGTAGRGLIEEACQA